MLISVNALILAAALALVLGRLTQLVSRSQETAGLVMFAAFLFLSYLGFAGILPAAPWALPASVVLVALERAIDYFDSPRPAGLATLAVALGAGVLVVVWMLARA